MQDWRAERDPRTYAIIGAAMKVHSSLGPGFLEVAYQRALAIEFGRRAIPFKQEVAVELSYEGIPLGVPFRVDFTCWDEVMVELKALPSTGRSERNQLIHYLRGSGFGTGLLINFGATSLQFERVVGPRHLETGQGSVELPFVRVAQAGSPTNRTGRGSVESQAAHTGPR